MFTHALMRRENYTTLRICVRVFLRMFAKNATVISVVTLASIFVVNSTATGVSDFIARAWPLFIVGAAASVILALQTAYEFQTQDSVESD